MGSKSRIAEWVLSMMPTATHFYDLFSGGCAMTHCATLSGKYKNIHANDILNTAELYAQACRGEISEDELFRWVSREEFNAKRRDNALIRMVWSFGTNGVAYCHGKDLEAYKYAYWRVISAPNIIERRKCMPLFISELAKLGRGISMGAKKFMEHIQRAERVLALKGTPPPQYTQCDYAEVEILPDSVIYCDIPYRDYNGNSTSKDWYGKGFDYERFYQWCAEQSAPLFISEYSMPEDRFVCIAQRRVTTAFSATNNAVQRIEKIFIPRHQVDGCKRNFGTQSVFEFEDENENNPDTRDTR